MTTPWGEIGFITFVRTYARWLDEKHTAKESLEQTVERVVKACRIQLKVGFTKAEEEQLRQTMLQLKGIVAGRFLWQLGTSTVRQLGMASLQNCAAVVVDDPVRPFTWAFDMLMLGCGVGYNLQKEHVYELPRVRKAKIIRRDTNDADFIVPDSREGWVRLLELTLKSHFGLEAPGGFSYSTVCVRGKGAAIRGFGGTASGPEELCWGIGEISRILNGRAGKKLNPVNVLDLMNIIGSIVVAGNVRRSAQIAMGDVDDRAFLAAKRWDLGTVPKWRSMSNNSVIVNDIEYALNMPELWEGYVGNGEPYGLINLQLARSVGRVGEDGYPDPNVIGFNPCAEQPLANYETCCLAELYLPNLKSEKEMWEATKLLYRINKHSLNLKCHNKETEDIVHANQRMGIGVTGYAQASDGQKSWLPRIYTALRNFDDNYSREQGWPASVKLTTVKPSGTLSLLAGVTPGCHPGYSQYFIRRIRISADSPLVETCREGGYHIEPVANLDGSVDTGTVVVEFPCSYPAGTTVAGEVGAIDQLETMVELQTNWSDNAVSNTIYYRKEELPAIKDWLKKNYNDKVKSCSFLLHSDHGFKQAPYEEITQVQYEDMVAKVRPITEASFSEDDMELKECEGGVCPVK